jgi:hypothetical protein
MLSRDPSDLRARALEASKRVPSVERHFDGVLALYAKLLAARVPPFTR